MYKHECIIKNTQDKNKSDAWTKCRHKNEEALLVTQDYMFSFCLTTFTSFRLDITGNVHNSGIVGKP